MADFRTVPQLSLEGLTADYVLGTGGDLDTTNELATAIIIALLTNRRAEDDDELPGFDSDRQGWWADFEAAEIWDAWPIGSRLWLASRAKIMRTTPAVLEEYIAEALTPFIERRIISSFECSLERTGTNEITGSIVLYRGPREAVELRFENLWTELRAA